MDGNSKCREIYFRKARYRESHHSKQVIIRFAIFTINQFISIYLIIVDA